MAQKSLGSVFAGTKLLNCANIDGDANLLIPSISE